MDSTMKQQALTRITALPDTASYRDILRVLRTLRPQKQRTFNQTQYPATERSDTAPSVSFLDAAQQYAGCIKDAPPDLSTNPCYMEGYGE